MLPRKEEIASTLGVGDFLNKGKKSLSSSTSSPNISLEDPAHFFNAEMLWRVVRMVLSSHPCVVDQDVQLAILGPHHVDNPQQGCLVHGVHGHGWWLPYRLQQLCQGCSIVRVPTCGHNSQTCLREILYQPQPYTSGTPSYQHNLSHYCSLANWVFQRYRAGAGTVFLSGRS